MHRNRKKKSDDVKNGDVLSGGNSVEPISGIEPNPQLPITQLIDGDVLGDMPAVVSNVGIASHIGTRSSQQDSSVIGIGNNVAPEFEGKFIAAVCDGMGGLRGGETASALCAKTIYEDFFSSPDIKNYPEFFMDEIDKIDTAVAALHDEDGNNLKAGSTFVSIIFDNGKLYWGCVGDSHLYIVRNGEMRQVNRDHNYMMLLKEQIKRGEITEEEANANPHKDALISYMGMNGIKYTDVNTKPFQLYPNDCVVLCSDGLYRLVSTDEMIDILNMNSFDMNRAAKAMVDAACDKMSAHQDNTTVIIFKYI